MGKLLPEDHIALNAICPNRIRTGISTAAVYDRAEKSGVLVPMGRLLAAFEFLLQDGRQEEARANGERERNGVEGERYYSGECFEIAPQQDRWRVVPFVEFVNEASRVSAEMTVERSHHLHEPIYD